MQIDWVTVAAQVVNFLVLVWLLQHFLYGPVTRAMKAREERIAARLADARKSRKEAEAEKDRLAAERREVEAKREEMISEARQEAEERRKEMVREAREEVDEMRAAWRSELESERSEFLSQLRLRAASHFHTLAKSAFADLADAELNDRLAAVFIERIDELDDKALDKVREAGEREGEKIVIEAAFELPADTKRRLTRAIHQKIAEGIDVSYATANDLACGIRLQAGGQTLEWSFDSYLDRLGEQLEQALDEETQTHRRDAAE